MPKCPGCGKLFEIKRRSNKQNSYYWGVCLPLISEHTGFLPEEVHEILKRRFLTEQRVLKTKRSIEFVDVPKSTTTLDTVSYEQFMSNVRMFASQELGISIPEPNEELNAETNKNWFNT